MAVHLKFLTAVGNEAVAQKDIDRAAETLLRKMVQDIRACTSTRKNADLVFLLPESGLLFPKQHLKEHMETRWERFARTKGIKRKQQSPLVYDEEVGEYIPRYGPYSKKNRMLGAAVRDGEISASALRRVKRKNVDKNQANMLANRARRE